LMFPSTKACRETSLLDRLSPKFLLKSDFALSPIPAQSSSDEARTHFFIHQLS
jgi:hypothetical protein